MTQRRALLYTAAAAAIAPVVTPKLIEVGFTSELPDREAAPATDTATAAAISAPRTTAIDVSAATGRSISGPITAWTTGTGMDVVEHVAGTTANGTLLVFYRSRLSNGWRVVDASAEAGRSLAVGAALTSWVTNDVEHVAGVGAGGELLAFYWSSARRGP